MELFVQLHQASRPVFGASRPVFRSEECQRELTSAIHGAIYRVSSRFFKMLRCWTGFAK